MDLEQLTEGIVRNSKGIEAVIAYGSKVFGEPTEDSMTDFWVVVDDYGSFYSQDQFRDYEREWIKRLPFGKEIVKRMLNNRQVLSFLNKISPNYFHFEIKDHQVKEAVISLDHLERGLDSQISMYIKGRFHKPVKITYTKNDVVKGRIERAIHRAREEAVDYAVSLLPNGFTFDEFAKKLISLSYKADIRPESPTKIDDILSNARPELRSIYEPLLKEQVIHAGDRYYYDQSSNASKVMLYLRANALISGFKNLKNFFTAKDPFGYVRRKQRLSK